MTTNWEPKTLLDIAQHHWHKPIGLLSSVAVTILFDILLLNSIKASTISSVTVYSITTISVIIVWFISNRLPKTKKGKVGFVVCIQCSNEEENEKIREDFVVTLRKLLKDGSLGYTFHFIEIPQHISKTINDVDDAFTLKAKTKAHFVIYGRVRLRILDGKDCHILELEGIVGHKPLPKEVGSQLANEFRELFPRRVHIPTENDLLSFNFTSDWTECVAKYIIGIASFCSLDLVYAEKLYVDVQKKIESIETDFPIFEKLKQRLPIRFGEIHLSRSNAFLNSWRKTNNKEYLTKFSLNLKRIPPDFPQNYNVLLLRGVEAFLNGRNVKKAFEYTKNCKKYDDPIWHFNLAFLYAYEGKLNKAMQQYRICEKYEISPITISEIEDFMVWILDQEPDKYQYHYCLGFFNWKIKGDFKRAIEDFKVFLNSAKQREFEKEKSLAAAWINEIENR